MRMQRDQGFSLIEMIIAVTIVAILALAAYGFVETGVKGYVESRNRDEMQSQARFASERMARELRHAVPNSVAVTDSGRCLMYTPIAYAGIYDQFVNGTSTLNVAIATEDKNWQQIVGDGAHRLVFMPMEPADLTGATAAGVRSFAITAAQDNQITLDKAPDAPWPPGSPIKRFYTYDQPVSFCFENGQLVRTVAGSGQSSPIAHHLLTSSHFALGDALLSRGSMVDVFYYFAQSGEQSEYNQKIQVLNAP